MMNESLEETDFEEFKPSVEDAAAGVVETAREPGLGAPGGAAGAR